MNSSIVTVITSAEQLHRRTLQLLSSELARYGIHKLNATQAMMLHQLGSQTASVGQLLKQGYYLGTNVSYSLRKLTECGLITQERSQRDQRITLVRATAKGMELVNRVDVFFAMLSANLSGSIVDSTEIAICRKVLSNFDRVVLLHLEQRRAAVVHSDDVHLARAAGSPFEAPGSRAGGSEFLENV